MMIATVGFGLLGLPGNALSGSAAVVRNSAYIVAARSGATPGGPS
ncbi:MAG: hypothetical protein PVH28_07640 [Desulfobacterales bacterium]